MPQTELKAWLEGVEVAVKILAFVAAGVWAVFALVYPRTRDRALADIRSLEAQTAKVVLEMKTMERDLREQATLQIEIGRGRTVTPGDRVICSSWMCRSRMSVPLALGWIGRVSHHR